jgi:hypothetical protein
MAGVTDSNDHDDDEHPGHRRGCNVHQHPSRDAVLTSRQYFNLGGGATAKWLAANVKVCKAMLLDEQDVNKLSKE